jgi:glyceraldehyde-3-phosphate dehydrogenase [NAD(P)+]
MLRELKVNILGPVHLPELPREFQDTMVKFGVFRVFIGGSWIDFGSYMPVKSPVNNEVFAYVNKLEPEHVDAAVEKLHSSWWSLKGIPAHN